MEEKLLKFIFFRYYLQILIQREFMHFFKFIIFTLLFLGTNISAEYKNLQHVSIQLEWKHQFEFAGFYAALEQGYYKDVGLNVEIKEYNSKIDIISDVLSGVSTYGMSSSHLILERLSGKKIIQLASYLKQNALVLITKPDIKTIEELKNKKVMAATNELKGTSLAAMFQEHHLGINDINVIPHSFNIDAFSNGDVDAMTAFISNQPFLLDQKQIPYKIFNPSNDGIYSYDVELFTSEDEVKDHPLRTQNFIDATRKGWEYALSHKEEIIKLIYQKYSKRKSKEALLYEANTIDKLMKTDLFKIGAVVPELTQLNTNMYVQLGMVDKNWDLEGFIFDPKPRHIDLTPAELAFIEAHPIIRFSDVQWEPFASIAKDNTYSGIFKTYYKLLEQRTGLKFEFVKIGDGINFQLVLDALKHKEIDMIDGSGKTKERKEYALFAGPLMQVSLAIVSNKQNRFTTLESLKGKHIAVAKGSTASEYIKEHFPQINLIYTDSIDETLNLVTNKKADASLDNLVVLDHMIQNNPNFHQIEISGISDYKFDLYSLIRNDYTLLHQIMDKAVKSISQEELLSINNKLLRSTVQLSKSQRDFLTPKELAFIKSHPKIVLGTEKAWKPYIIVKKNGMISGYDADVLKLINQVSGSNFVLEAGDWAKMQTKAKVKEIDGLSTGGIHEERKKYLNFSDIYISMRKMLLVSKENPKNIHTLNDLNSKIIAIHKSNLVDEKIARKFLNSKILRLDTIEEVITSVTTGQADAMFGNGATFYLANELGLPYLKRVAQLDDTLDLAFGIRKDWPEAVSIINKSLAYIGEHKLLELKNKWFWQDKVTLLDKSHKKLRLTEREEQYLGNKKQLKVCVDPNWMPFEKIEKGQHVGMSAEYINIISSRIGTPITLVPTRTWVESMKFSQTRKCDLLSLVMETPSRKEYLNFTTPYLNIPLVIATTNDKFFVTDIEEIKGKKIGIVKGYAFAELLKEKYPNIEFIETITISDGLKDVIRGKTFGFIDNLTTIGYQIQKNFANELKIAGRFNETWKLGIGVRNDDPDLLSILNKAIASIDEKTKQQIINQWVSVKYEKGFDYKLFWQILVPFLILALLLLISHFALRAYNKKLKKEIAHKIEELRHKDEILLKKHRMAEMGEMLSMIAHQWKQPLGAISSAVMGIEVKMESGKFNLDNENDREKFLIFLKRKHHSINDYVQHLSTTTDEFRNFFNPNKIKEDVLLTSPIESALKIVQKPMENNGIEIIKDFKVDAQIELYQNEVLQVILNLLKNSEDNFLEKNILDPKVTISTYTYDNNYIISICDNGGGISEHIIDKIFDPYFSTKDEKNGAGLGLYMSKIMIEDHHKGILNVKNTQDGICFKISFKIRV